jgi:hypothetical protein
VTGARRVSRRAARSRAVQAARDRRPPRSR